MFNYNRGINKIISFIFRSNTDRCIIGGFYQLVVGRHMRRSILPLYIIPLLDVLMCKEYLLTSPSCKHGTSICHLRNYDVIISSCLYTEYVNLWVNFLTVIKYKLVYIDHSSEIHTGVENSIEQIKDNDELSRP